MRPVLHCVRLVAAAALGVSASAASADVVIDWNNVVLDTIRAEGGPPCPISRACAMTHVAVFEAVNSIDRAFDPYLGYINTPADTSDVAAAAQAARDVLVHLYPARQAIYDAALTTSLSTVPAGPAKDAGIALGQAAAAAVIEARANDGTQSEPPYQLVNQPGYWRPTYPDFTSPPFNPGWGGTLPWSMLAGAQFRSQGPNNHKNMNGLVHSRGYADQVNEIKDVGARNSKSRTEEQTRIAFFWANDVNGTYKPPGHLFTITQVVSQNQNLTLLENARLFALVAAAMGDAGLVSWDMKYRTNIDLWRPISAIRLAGTDGNPHTAADPNWEPLNPFTPPFPSYTSGHATFGAAYAGVMQDFFATDDVTFTVDSEDPFYNALPVHGPRTFHKFSDAAWENAMSRLYLGVHYRFDAVDGNKSGLKVGHWVYQQLFGKVLGADFNSDGRLATDDVTAFYAAMQSHDWRADFNRDGRVNARDTTAFLLCYTTHCQ